MSSGRDAFLAAIQHEPKNYHHRYVYADWLDEQGEHEEADRQRKYEAAEKWLRAFAKSHELFGYEDDSGEEDVVGNVYHSYHQLLYFLERHCGDDHYLPFDTPYGFKEYSETLWQNFEVVTGTKSPSGEYRTTMPPFRCSC